MKIHAINTNTTTHNEAISRIVIYGNGKKLYETDNGYFEEISFDFKNHIRSVYDGRISALTLNTEPKRARLENLTRKDNYLLSYTRTHWGERGLALYIHVSEIAVTEEGEQIACCANGETNYKTIYRLRFSNPVTFYRCKIEEVKNAGDHFTPPEGCKWSDGYSRDPEHPNYHIVRNSYFMGNNDDSTRVIKKWMEEETASEMIVDSDQYTRTVKDDARQQREKIADFINSKKIFYREVSHYEIERLQQFFEIKLKEGENL